MDYLPKGNVVVSFFDAQRETCVGMLFVTRAG
jgi:hypothetical protein